MDSTINKIITMLQEFKQKLSLKIRLGTTIADIMSGKMSFAEEFFKGASAQFGATYIEAFEEVLEKANLHRFIPEEF